jgi:hypothetical protein
MLALVQEMPRTAISIDDERRVCARLASGLRGRRALLNDRQLQHGHALPFKELRYEHTASIWKFDCIMVTIRNVLIYLAEFSHSEINPALPKPSVVVFDSFGERQFGPRKHADRYRRLPFRREATRRGPAECRGDERLSNLGGARCYSVQTIVTHRIAPSFEIANPRPLEAQASIRVDISLARFASLWAIVRL